MDNVCRFDLSPVRLIQNTHDVTFKRLLYRPSFYLKTISSLVRRLPSSLLQLFGHPVTRSFYGKMGKTQSIPSSKMVTAKLPPYKYLT